MITRTVAPGRSGVLADPDPDFDRRMMSAAIHFGQRGLGLSAPNPSVGAIVVRDGVIVGRGVTGAGGRPHAETLAIQDAGEKARGATLYVSLEPCSHFGLTPPCAQTIIEAGLARVVSSLDDPDSRVSGRGHAMLLAAGVALTSGVCAEFARCSHIGHIMRVTRGRPAVLLKLAETADGYAAGDAHDARLMITGQAANNRVQIMRAMADAVMTGIGTVRADDPLLTVRLAGLEGRNPLRVVVDGRLEIPLRSRLVATAEETSVLVFACPDASRQAEEGLRGRGCDVVRVPASAEGYPDLQAVLAVLGARGVTRVLSEGGPKVGSALIAAGLADEVAIFTSPKPLGRPGTPSLTAPARDRLNDEGLFRREPDALTGVDRLRVWRRKD